MRLFTWLLLSTSWELAQAVVYNATFTWYGTGDERNSANCNTKSTACGFYSSPGFSAAVSQNLFGASSGKGPYCNKCLKLNPTKDETGKTLNGVGRDIVVVINNLCPANGNPLCAQKDLNSKNRLDATIDVNVCSDSGAKAAVFGSSGVGLAVGTAEEVDCRSWNGTKLQTGTGVSLVNATDGGGLIGNVTTTGTPKKSGAKKLEMEVASVAILFGIFGMGL